MLTTTRLIAPLLIAAPGSTVAVDEVEMRGPQIAVAEIGTAPQVAADPEGGFVVVWSTPASESGDAFDILSHEFDRHGAPLRAEPRRIDTVTNVNSRDVVEAVVAVDAGHHVITWRSDEGIAVQRFPAGDSEPQASVTLPATRFAMSPAIATGPGGGFTVLGRGLAGGLYAQRFDTAGAMLGAAVEVVAPTGDCLLGDQADLAIGGDGSFVVFYPCQLPGSLGPALFAQRFRADGVAVGGPLEVSDGDSGFGYFTPRVAINSLGGLTAVWGAGDGGLLGTHTFDLVARGFDRDGRSLGKPKVLARDLSEGAEVINQGYGVAADGGNHLAVVYADGRGRAAAAHVQMIDAAGEPVGEPLTVHTGSDSPSISGGPHGRFVVAYDTPSGIRAHRLLRPQRLLNDRFRVDVTWRDFGGSTGEAIVVPRSSDSATLWFFRPGNLELTVKVLDGRPLNDHVWVFFASTTNVAFTLTVTDTETGDVRIYENPTGRFASRGDIEAFPAVGLP